MARKKKTTEATVREIRRRTRRKFSAEEKVRIVLEACAASAAWPSCAVVRASPPIPITGGAWTASWAGKKRLAGDTVREANTDEVNGLRRENTDLKQVVAELTLDNRRLKKSSTGEFDRDDDS